MHEHICRLDADPDHPGEQLDHCIASFPGCPLQPLEAGRLNLFDLLFDEAEASHVASQLGQGVWRQSGTFRGAHRFKTL